MSAKTLKWSRVVVAVITAACVDQSATAPTPGPNFDKEGVGRPVVLVNPNVQGNGTATTTQEGIDMVAEGGRVMIKPGTYHEEFTITKGLTLEAIDPETGPVILVPDAGFAAPTIQVTATAPVTIRGLTVYGAQRAFQGVGPVDLTIEDNIVLGNTLTNAPLIGTTNSALTTGGRAHVVIARNFVDGLDLPIQNFGIITSGDVDAIITHNVVRRVGAACIWARLDNSLTGVTNVDIIANDVDLCHPVGRGGPILVGGSANASVPSPQLPLTASGVVNVVGNLIRNSDASCLVTNGIGWEYLSGRIEHNRILAAIAPCAIPTAVRHPTAIWVGSLRGFPPVAPVIRFNDIVGNAQAGLRLAPNITSVLDASCNWWGSASGPSSVGTSTGPDAIVIEAGAATPVFAPFATAPIAESNATGC